MLSYITTDSANKITGKINDMVGLTNTAISGGIISNYSTIYKKYITNRSSSSYAKIKTTEIPDKDNYYFGIWFNLNTNGELYIKVEGNSVIRTIKNSSGTALLYEYNGSSYKLKDVNSLGSKWNFICLRNGEFFVYNEENKNITLIPTDKSYTNSIDSVSVELLNGNVGTAFITEINPTDRFLNDFIHNALRIKTDGTFYFNFIDTNTYKKDYGKAIAIKNSGEVNCLSIDEFLELNGDGAITATLKNYTADLYSGLSLESSLKRNFLSYDSLFYVKSGTNEYCFYGYDEIPIEGKNGTTEILYSNLSACGLEQYLELIGNGTRQSKIDYFLNNNFSNLKNATSAGDYTIVEDTSSVRTSGIYKTEKEINGELINGLNITCEKIMFVPEE